MDHAIDKTPRNDGGETPLHFAAHDCTAKNLEICQQMIENVDGINHADINVKKLLDCARELI